MAGLCFRVAAVPLHFYAPDVYQGSPIVIAAVLAWVPKAVGFLAIVRALDGRSGRERRRRSLVAAGGHALVGHRGGDHDLGQLRRPAPGKPQAAAGLFVDRARRLPDGRRDRRLRQRATRRRRLLRLRGRLLLPGRLRADDAGGLRRVLRGSRSRAGRSRRSTTSPAWAGLIPGRPWRFRSAC